MINTEKDYNIIVGKLAVGDLNPQERFDLMELLAAIEGMLDEADSDDYFGTEGWRHRLGWD